MPTWMVVEDEPDIYDVLMAMFEIWGIEGVAFVDGPDVMRWIEDIDQGRVRCEMPELALLDVRLPVGSGPEVGARLRQSPLLGDIPIVLITAYHMSPEEEKAALEQAQADMLLYKPLPGLAELREKMDGVIARRKRARVAEVSVAAAEIVPASLSAARISPSVRPEPAKPEPARPATQDTPAAHGHKPPDQVEG